MKKVLITGAAGGIGKAIVRYFLQREWEVIGSDIDCELLDEFLGYASFEAIQIDVTSDESIAGAMQQISTLTSSLDALINCAGIFDHFPLAEASPGQLESILSVNVVGVARMTSAFFPMLYAAKGRIVNLSSETAMASLPMQIYGVSKGMLEVYTDALRQELNLLGMSVILVRPGAHTTNLFAHSRDILGRIEEDSVFSDALTIVRDRGRKIIDQGAADPQEIAEVAYRAVTSIRPRRIYHVNVSSRFKILEHLPRRLKEFLVHRMLTSKG